MIRFLTWEVNNDTIGGKVAVTMTESFEEVINMNIEIDSCVIATI